MGCINVKVNIIKDSGSLILQRGQEDIKGIFGNNDRKFSKLMKIIDSQA
jgi:hypothetical protein